MNNEELFKRAKNVDEPYVKNKLTTKYNLDIHDATISEDLNHSDLICYLYNKKFGIDVKRNSPKYWNSDNFTFTVINENGVRYPFRENAYLAFIDDITGDIILILKSKFEYLVNNKKQYPGCNNLAKFVIVSKSEIISKASSIVKGTEEDVEYLKRNR